MRTIEGMYTYVDFGDNNEYLQEDLLIYTKFFNYKFGIKDDKYLCFIAPKGTSTDGASIPSLARRFIGICPRDKKIRLPATGHDVLYLEGKIEMFRYDKQRKEIGESLGVVTITQSEADGFIRDKMKDVGAGFIDRNIVFIGLAIGGHKAWNKYRKLDNLELK